MQFTTPCPPLSCWLQMRASGSLIHWQLLLGIYSWSIFPPSRLCCLLRFKNSPRTCLWVFPTVCKLLLHKSLPRAGLHPCLLSVSVIYIPSYLLWKRLGCISGLPGVLHQCSEIVLWKLFSIQMIFWWICGWEIGLSVLFKTVFVDANWQYWPGTIRRNPQSCNLKSHQWPGLTSWDSFPNRTPDCCHLGLPSIWM